MPHRDVIVVGASFGGVEALLTLVPSLPADLPAAVLVVQHVPADHDSRLPALLDRKAGLRVAHAQDGEALRSGRVYVAPPDYHLFVQGETVRLAHGPRENRVRPAIDPLFRSAARYHGRRVIGVLLSGASNDGVAGLMAVRNAGGVGVVQSPESAVVDELPQAAIKVAGADFVRPLHDLAACLTQLVHEETRSGGPPAMSGPYQDITELAARDKEAQARGQRKGEPSVYSCPECGGVLWQLGPDRLAVFACHVGHAYSGEELLADQTAALEAALWTAVRTFRERATLSRQMAGLEHQRGNESAAGRFEEQAANAERDGDLIQTQLLAPPAGRGPGAAEAPSEP